MKIINKEITNPLNEWETEQQRIDNWFAVFRKKWLSAMVVDVNKILKKYKSSALITAPIVIKSYVLPATEDTKIYDEINGIEHVVSSALYLLGLRDKSSWQKLDNDRRLKSAFAGLNVIFDKYMRRYYPPCDYENKIKRLIGNIGTEQLLMWRNVNFGCLAKKEQRILTDIKSMLKTDCEIEIKTIDGQFAAVTVRNNGSRCLNNPMMVGWFSFLLGQSECRNRFFDSDTNECSIMSFRSGAIFDSLKKCLLETVTDFGAGDGSRIGAKKSIVLVSKPIYQYIKQINPNVSHAEDTISLLGLGEILSTDDFTTYIDKISKME